MDTKPIIDLINAGARLSTIHELTGISATKARYLWHLENKKPPIGRSPSIHSLLRTQHGHIEASISGQIVKNLMRQGLSPVRIIHIAYVTCTICNPLNSITVEHVYMIYRLMATEAARMTKCSVCSGNILMIANDTKKTRKCCYCRTPLPD